MARKKLGEILVEHGALSQAQLEKALEDCRLGDGPLGHYLVHLGWLTYGDIAKAVSVQAGRPYVPPELLVPQIDEMGSFPEGMLEELQALPVKGEADHTFAVAAPKDISMVAELERELESRIKLVVTDEDAIPKALRGRYNRNKRRQMDGETQDRRWVRRLRCSERIIAHYCFKDASGTRLFDTNYRGQLLDISPGGGRIAGGLPLEDDRVRLIEPAVTFEAEIIAVERKAQPPIHMKGEVMWVQKTVSHYGEIGVAWQPEGKMDTACHKALLLREHQAEAAERARPARLGASRLPEVPEGLEVIRRH